MVNYAFISFGGGAISDLFLIFNIFRAPLFLLFRIFGFLSSISAYEVIFAIVIFGLQYNLSILDMLVFL